MINFLTGVLTLVFLILKNQFNLDEEQRKKAEKAHEDWDKAVTSGDVDTINRMLAKLRS